VGAPSGTVTFLFTDIEGSTRLWQQDEKAMRAALSRHDELLRKAIGDNDGVVFSSMGDGVAAAFSSASAAVAAAVTAQRLFEVETWVTAAPIRVRMGIHTGEAVVRDGDYLGTVVNRTARLMAIGHGGQVLCSQASAAVVGAGVPDGAVLVDLGERRLRDLSEPIRVFQVRHRELQAEFPRLRSVDAVATNLPIVRTELIGRTGDLEMLTALVERERLVTLVGVGGVGKTRLALAVAAALAAGFADGCWLVELAAVAEGSEVARTVAGAIGAPMSDQEALVGYLADRRMLIVLDNCEHVLGDAAELLDALLAACPDVHVVATSREPVGLDGEQVRRVQSLVVPGFDATPGESAQAAAVRLFAARAAAVSDHFEIGDTNVDAVSEICRHLDGIPLAIELAAARVRAMPPVEIAGRLEKRFRLLAGGSRRAQERHRTLLAAVSWSHDLLGEDEQIVFRRLCVFPSGFDLVAAEAVVGEVGLDVVDCVVRLVDRSLVQYEPEQGRYRLLETLRQYGRDRLADAAETDETRERHARFYLGLIERIAPELLDARYRGAHARFIVELDNLRATTEWCNEHDRWVELAAMVRQSWLFSWSAPVDGARWYQQVIDHSCALDPQTLIDALGELAYLQGAVLGAFATGEPSAQRSLALAETGRLEPSPWAWLARAAEAAVSLTSGGAGPDGLGPSELGLAAAQVRHDQPAASIALNYRMIFLWIADPDPDSGVAAMRDALDLAEGIGNPMLITSAAFFAVGCLTWGAEADFAAGLDILGRYDDGVRVGGYVESWLDVEWGIALLGLRQPGALEHLARAARLADRLSILLPLEVALRLLAVAYAEDGCASQAATLVGYADANLSQYRLDTAGLGWTVPRLERALAGLADRSDYETQGSTWDRRQIMGLINELSSPRQ
jgi:predicted ATPase/class 3 adenylate cyclase